MDKLFLDKIKKKSIVEIEKRFSNSETNSVYIFPKKRDEKYIQNYAELDDIGLIYDLNS